MNRQKPSAMFHIFFPVEKGYYLTGVYIGFALTN